MFKIIVELFFLVIIQAAITPFIRRLAFVLGAVDNPNARRVNKKPMPTLGGLGIFVTYNIGAFVLLREQFPTHELFSVLLASNDWNFCCGFNHLFLSRNQNECPQLAFHS